MTRAVRTSSNTCSSPGALKYATCSIKTQIYAKSNPPPLCRKFYPRWFADAIFKLSLVFVSTLEIMIDSRGSVRFGLVSDSHNDVLCLVCHPDLPPLQDDKFSSARSSPCSFCSLIVFIYSTCTVTHLYFSKEQGSTKCKISDPSQRTS